MSYKYNPLLKVGLDEAGPGGGGGTPGGSDTQIQFNDLGSFGGDVNLTWNKTTNVMTVAGDVNLSDGGTYTTTLQTITPTANRTVSIPDATGTVALVAGSSGQPVYNNAGAYAGLSTATIGTTGNITLSLNGALNTPPVKINGTWVTTGGTGETTKPQVLIEPTGTTSTAWSTSGTGLGVNAASGFNGNLLDLQVNGTSKLTVSSNGAIGTVTASDFTIQTGGVARVILGGVNGLTIAGSVSQVFVDCITYFASTTAAASRCSAGSGFKVGSSYKYEFSSTSGANGTPDAALARDQAGVVAITNGSTGTGYLKQTPVAVSALPAAATVGAGTRGFVSDSTVAASGNFGVTVTGGGSNKVPVFSDGTNWLIG